MEDSSDLNEPRDPREKPCPFCNNTQFTWGKAVVGDQSKENSLRVFFRPEGGTFEDGDMMLSTRQCDVCGNVIFFNVDI